MCLNVFIAELLCPAFALPMCFDIFMQRSFYVCLLEAFQMFTQSICHVRQYSVVVKSLKLWFWLATIHNKTFQMCPMPCPLKVDIQEFKSKEFEL